MSPADLIQLLGPEDALLAHLNGLQPPLGDLITLYGDCQRAIEAVAEGRPDQVIFMDGGEPGAFAHHLVSIFDLQPWVEELCVTK